MEEKAVWTTAYKNSLPDSSFLYVEPGGEKDEEGKTKPRTKRHMPVKDKEGNIDLVHVQNALSRLGQSNTGKGWLSASLRKQLRTKAEGLLKRHKKEIDEIIQATDFTVDNLETKEQSPDVEKMYGWTSAKDFEEYEEEKKALEVSHETIETAQMIPVFVRNINYDPLEDNKPSRISAMLNQAIKKFGSIFGSTKEIDPVPEDEPDGEAEKESGLLIFKNANGEYVWLARYSNNTRDNDYPPEIIAAKSHKRFVEMVDKGIYPMPELWLWHNKNWKVGRATVVDFDEDTGFAIAAGLIDKDKAWVAEALIQVDPTKSRLSHGMPIGSIVRDQEDPTIIVEHQTKEISWLPAEYAANKLTEFVVLTAQKEKDNMLDTQKAEKIETTLGVPKEQIAALEEANAADKAKVDKEGIETKQKAETEEPNPEAKEAAEETPEPAPQDTTDAPPSEPKEAATPPALTAQDIADAIKMAFDPLATRLEAIENRMKELGEADEAKIAKEAATTPRESLFAITKSVIGMDETQVDGRTKEGRDQPKETQVPQPNGMAAVPFLRDPDHWRDSFKEISQ